MNLTTQAPKFGATTTPHQQAIDTLLQREAQPTDHVRLRVAHGRYVVITTRLDETWCTRAEALRILRDLPTYIHQLPPTTK